MTIEMHPQDIDDLQAIGRYVVNQNSPELSSCYLATEFRNVDDSLSEFHHIYPFKDNQY